jgi:hypothetical protein
MLIALCDVSNTVALFEVIVAFVPTTSTAVPNTWQTVMSTPVTNNLVTLTAMGKRSTVTSI